MTATIDRELLGRLTMQIEMIANRRGWDAPANLYVLYDWRRGDTEAVYNEIMTNTGEVIRWGRYAARPLIRHELLGLGGRPHHNLFRMALNLAHGGDQPPMSQFVEAVRQEGFIGVAFCVEAWGRTYGSQEARDADGDVRFVDMPGSIELRNVWAVDTSGRDTYVERKRGQKAQLHTPDDIRNASGAVIESLRAITARIAGLPVPEIRNPPVGWVWPEEASR